MSGQDTPQARPTEGNNPERVPGAEKAPLETTNAGNAWKGLSWAALGMAVVLILGILALVAFALYSALGFTTGLYFWLGILCFVIVVVCYFGHMATNNAALLGATGLFGIIGVILVYSSILLGSGTIVDKTVPLVIFTLIVVFLLLMVAGGARSAGKQKEREALRKRT